jgi:CubicO group peptidase (beta-lactamase class C family)
MRLTIFSIVLLLIARCGSNTSTSGGDIYFPPSDSLGGWRYMTDADQILLKTGIEVKKLDEAFDYVRTTTRNGGLLVARHGWLVYENYFGKGQRDAAPNLASCGKSFTSVSVGILMSEHPELFPDGLNQKVFTPEYLPEMAFPLADPRMAEIKLGQLLSFSAGIRGNNPVYIKGKPLTIDPVGPDGWYAMVDSIALGKSEGIAGTIPYSAKTLWCEPGGGYSYATASIHIASIMLRHLTGMELKDYIRLNLAEPLGWGRWGFGYSYQSRITHTPGGGGIALRSTDMLRFCYLLLQKGNWKGTQLIPVEYIRKATSASPYNPHYPYSLQFNVNTNGEEKTVPRDAFWKGGSGGHCLYVVPSLDLVVWKLGGRDGQYSSNDTNLPEPDPAEGLYGPTENITATGDINIRTLEMVLDAIVKK